MVARVAFDITLCISGLRPWTILTTISSSPTWSIELSNGDTWCPSFIETVNDTLNPPRRLGIFRLTRSEGHR
jgi:hypothetical protein